MENVALNIGCIKLIKLETILYTPFYAANYTGLNTALEDKKMLLLLRGVIVMFQNICLTPTTND